LRIRRAAKKFRGYKKWRASVNGCGEVGRPSPNDGAQATGICWAFEAEKVVLAIPPIAGMVEAASR